MHYFVVKSHAKFTRMLGYTSGVATLKSRFGEVSSVFAMDDVSCRGYEASLHDCRHNERENCGPYDGAGVICSNRGKMFLQSIG